MRGGLGAFVDEVGQLGVEMLRRRASGVDPGVAGDRHPVRLVERGDGHVDALTDGILVLRYLFGLRGGALIQDAVAIGALRKTAQEIATRVRFLSEI